MMYPIEESEVVKTLFMLLLIFNVVCIARITLKISLKIKVSRSKNYKYK